MNKELLIENLRQSRYDYNVKYNPSVFDELTYVDGVRYSDSYFLLRDKNITSKIPEEVIRKMGEAINSPRQPSLYSGQSDDTIFNSIKSRRISEISDMKSYIDNLAKVGELAENRVNELKKLAEERELSEKKRKEIEDKIEKLVSK